MNKQLIGYILLGIFVILAIAGGIILVIIRNSQKSGGGEGNCDPKMCKFPHGKCVQNKCVCETGWSGEDCLTPSTKCDPTKCKYPNGFCNKNGICECNVNSNYAGENCLTKCQDDERSLLCVNNLTYKCCDKSINSCDLNNNCCETGLKPDKKSCDGPWTCNDTSFDYLGKCSSSNCPENWCPDMKFIFCEEDKIVKHKMYLFTNSGTDTYRTYKTNCSEPKNKCVDSSWYYTRKTCLGPTSANRDLPDAISYKDKSLQPGYKKLNPDSYVYIDDNRPNKSLDECNDDPWNEICTPPIKSSGEGDHTFFNSVWADPSYIWSLQKYKYVQFAPNKPNSLLFQICNMYTKSFTCDMILNKNPPGKPVCIGMGPRSGRFPDPKTQLGTFFSFSKEAQFFPSLPDSSEYGSWTEGVPWVEFEQPVCGGMVDGKPSKIRNPKFPNGCTNGPTPDDKTIYQCGPVAKHRPFGSYMFVRVQDPTSKQYYRFYLGCPPNIGDPATCERDSLKDENKNPIGGCYSSGDSAGICESGNCSQTTLFFFTEDEPYGLEKYLSAESCLKAEGTPQSAGMPYCWNSAGGESNQLDLFLWNNLEINPLPPNTADAWQKNSIENLPNCSISSCNLPSTFWVSPVSDQGNQGLYCHNINAEKAPNIDWQKIQPQNLDKMSQLPSDVSQPTPGVYYSKCLNGSQVSDSDICDLYSISTAQMSKNIDGSCNVQGQDFCDSGIKQYSYETCMNSSITDLYYEDDKNNCVKNTDGSIKYKKDLYPDKYCSNIYKCSVFS